MLAAAAHRRRRGDGRRARPTSGPATVSDAQDQEDRRRRRRPRSRLVQNPDILAELSAHRPARRHGGRRLRRRDRRRARLGARARRAPSWPARAATCSSSTTSAAARSSAARRTRPSSSARDGQATGVPRGSKAALAHVIWDARGVQVADALSASPRPAGYRGRAAHQGGISTGGAAASRTSTDREHARGGTTFHLRVGDRGAPGQDRRPDQRHASSTRCSPTTRTAGSRSRRW